VRPPELPHPRHQGLERSIARCRQTETPGCAADRLHRRSQLCFLSGPL